MKILFVLSLLLVASTAYHGIDGLVGWGHDGHEATGYVANAFVSPQVQVFLQKAIPEVNGDLSQIANWADKVKDQTAYKWSEPLHFINTPDWACNYNKTRDCHDKWDPINGCCSGAITNYTSRLADTSLSMDQRTEALKFLVHFIGDIHQPLHVGFTSDYGGNKIKGSFFNESANLHGIWDYNMIIKYKNENYDYRTDLWADALSENIRTIWKSNATSWTNCTYSVIDGACTRDWADRSIELACSNAYVAADGVTHLESGFEIGEDYYNKNMKIINMQIAKAGLRIANVLNLIFANSSL